MCKIFKKKYFRKSKIWELLAYIKIQKMTIQWGKLSTKWQFDVYRTSEYVNTGRNERCNHVDPSRISREKIVRTERDISSIGRSSSVRPYEEMERFAIWRRHVIRVTSSRKGRKVAEELLTAWLRLSGIRRVQCPRFSDVSTKATVSIFIFIIPSQSQSYFTNGGSQSISSYWCQALWGSRPAIFFSTEHLRSWGKR
jgi:hypothetical protein